jgi:hypothetical protein
MKRNPLIRPLEAYAIGLTTLTIEKKARTVKVFVSHAGNMGNREIDVDCNIRRIFPTSSLEKFRQKSTAWSQQGDFMYMFNGQYTFNNKVWNNL